MCKKEDTLVVDLHYEYFPVEKGTWIAYKVDSIAYNDFTQTVDTFLFYVKEIVESEFDDNEGRLNQRIERYYKDSLNGNWLINSAWYSCKLPQRVERVEDNVRYLKMIFPIANNKKWNGNAYNNLPPLEYAYKNVHENYSVSNINLDSTLIITQEDEQTLFTEKISFEVYAKHIGCIYKQHNNISKLANGEIVSGYKYTYEAFQWGH